MLNTAGQNLTMRLRKHLFESFLKQEIVWFDQPENDVGTLCAILAGESANVQSVSVKLIRCSHFVNKNKLYCLLSFLKASGLCIGTILNSAGTLLLCLIVAFYYQWKLTLVCFVIPTMCLAIVICEQQFSQKVQADMQESVEGSLKVVLISVLLL